MYGLVLIAVNHARPVPSIAIVRDARLSAADWILRHREDVLQEDNAVLWWMVARSAALTHDSALKALVDEYRGRYMVPRTGDPQRQLFGLTYQGGPLNFELLATFEDYQALFFYALTCDRQAPAPGRIAAQQNADFCPDSQPLRPACTTHQLMGLRLAEEFGCMSADATSATKGVLLKRIERQLFWDVRLVDTYLQRTLMLTEERGPSGAGAPALQNVLSVRMPDGGWSRSQPLVPVGQGKWLGVTETGFGIIEKRGQFHATAQALLLFSLVESGVPSEPATATP
jgi:hypothetical protein